MYHPKASPAASTYLLPFSSTIEAGEASNLNLGAGRIFSYGELGTQFLSGYEASDHPRSIFVKLASGKELWRYVEASRSSLPIGFVQLEGARNFAVSVISGEDIHQPSDLRITELDASGDVRRSATFPLMGHHSSGFGSSIRVGNSLLVAIPVYRTEAPAPTINPLTGSRPSCWGIDDTELIRIDLQQMTLIKRSMLRSARVTQIREVDGRPFLSFVRDKHCSSISSGIVEIPQDLEIRDELEAAISDVEVLDFSRAGASWIVGGRARRNVFALKAPSNATSPPDIWSEEIWESGGEAVWNGFVATIRDNKIMTSKIFYDPRGGVVSRIVSNENSIVLGGGIAGDRVWVAEMSIQFSRPSPTKINK